MNLDALRLAYPGRRIDHYPVLDSTMHAAAQLPPGSVVVADEQTAGQGRRGHSWHSAPGAGLYCSIALDLPLALDAMPTITLALGLAAVDAIRQVAGLACDIRWPNDVMVGSRKLAGILVQMTGGMPVAGIGINVAHTAFPADIAHLATSLRIETGRHFSREALLATLVPAVDRESKVLVEEGREVVIRRFTAVSSYAQGKQVVVDLPEGGVAGVTDGLDETGFLRLRRDDGSVTTVLAGGVRAV